jgi:Flp pilus assembly pilin Flp
VKTMVDRMCRDERGAGKAGVALVVGLLLVLLVGAVEFGGLRLGARAPGVLSAGSVAAHQQDALRRSSVASRGGHQPSEQPGVAEQQRAQLSTDGQGSSGRGIWQIPESSATRTPSWGRQIGRFVYETLPEVLWSLLQALGEGIGRIL